MVAPPSVPEERLTDWRRANDLSDTPFAAPGLTVTARILLYEDDRLRAAVRERTGVDRSWRFFLATRLELTPSPPVTGALRGLVASRAGRGFADRLEDRGFEAVERTERRSLRVGDDDARLFGYDARCRVDGVTLSVDGWLAVWAPDRTFRLAGGAYPIAVVDDDGETADALADCLDPSAFRAELFELIRGVG
jgi:hypothetical protein